MAVPIPLRGDYDAKSLRRLAKGSDDADQPRRLLALAAVYDGARGVPPPRSAALGCRRCGTGCSSSMRRGQLG